MTRKPIREVLHPVYARLEDEASLLRRSGDVSMLAQALLDVCECKARRSLNCKLIRLAVDLAIEVSCVLNCLVKANWQISQAFESEILRLEASVLVDPSVCPT
jgi:hypothetical protein